LKLVGISMDTAVPEESLAIIRNKVDSKTYFVKVGESVGDTGIILARVLADRVILKSQKQELELK
jgi:type II secretory pathway component PulC